MHINMLSGKVRLARQEKCERPRIRWEEAGQRLIGIHTGTNQGKQETGERLREAETWMQGKDTKSTERQI